LSFWSLGLHLCVSVITSKCQVTLFYQRPLTLNEFLVYSMFVRTLFNFQCPFLSLLSCFQPFCQPVSGDSFFILPPSLFLVKHFFNFFRAVLCACSSWRRRNYILPQSRFPVNSQLLAVCLFMRFFGSA